MITDVHCSDTDSFFEEKGKGLKIIRLTIHNLLKYGWVLHTKRAQNFQIDFQNRFLTAQRIGHPHF